ncbi:MAG: hypothetical protein Q9201_006377 [Fulgogasparrea decipioides]
MAVPKMFQLQRGTNVDIVLKADQRSGRLTTGQIADILTKGDHPRGVKVRLTNGQIGRVQSISGSAVSPQSTSQHQPSNSIHGGTDPPPNPAFKAYGTYDGGGMVQDVRKDGYDVESHNQSSSLFDYLRPTKKSKAAAKPQVHDQKDEASPQIRLEAEFPNIDSALIAAILADYPVLDEARVVLRELS